MKLLIDIILFLSLLATCVSLNAFANDNRFQNSIRAGSRRMDECSSVKDVICGLGNTRTFCEMVTTATQMYTEFEINLEGGTPFTVFAPTDDAFEELEDLLIELTPDELYRTLLFHFYEDVVSTFDNLVCSGKMISLTGDESRTKCQRKDIGIYVKNQRGSGNKAIGNYPTIDIKSKEACTGIIHRIDHVMLPTVFKPFKVLVEEVKEIPESKDSSEELAEQVTEISESKDRSEDPIITNEDGKKKDDAEKDAEEVNNDVLTIPDKEPSTTVDFDSNEEQIGGFSDIDFDRDNEPKEVIPGTELEYTKPDPESMTIQVADATIEEEEPPAEGPRIGALGINLIIFATLLLCFVFVCMRRS